MAYICRQAGVATRDGVVKVAGELRLRDVIGVGDLQVEQPALLPEHSPLPQRAGRQLPRIRRVPRPIRPERPRWATVLSVRSWAVLNSGAAEEAVVIAVGLIGRFVWPWPWS